MDAYHSTLWIPQIEDKRTNKITIYALGDYVYTLCDDVNITNYQKEQVY